MNSETPSVINSLTISQVTKTFAQGGATISVLSGISAQFTPGISVAITGASGSGKSTLLHLLAGLDQPTSGTVSYGLASLQTMNSLDREAFLNQVLGLVFQAPYLVSELSVIENVMIKGLIAGKSVVECTPLAMKLLSDVGLHDKITALPATLSGGQQQRVAIARALFGKPSFVLADEPTGNLDRDTGKQIVDMLLRTTKENRAGLIIVSHDMYVESVVDQVWHLTNGKLERVR
jgi:ABC-type lipoprotein export system ATPase subunit